MNKVLIDTSVIIDYLRRPDKKKALLFKYFTKTNYQAVVALTTVAELWAGKSMARKKVRLKVGQILNRCQIVFPDLKTAKLTGKLIRDLNYELAFQDAQIAALAIQFDLPVLTLNQKHFKSIKDLKLAKE
jgi:tRNA(fMet)-specific endonuclease VapC